MVGLFLGSGLDIQILIFNIEFRILFTKNLKCPTLPQDRCLDIQIN